MEPVVNVRQLTGFEKKGSETHLTFLTFSVVATFSISCWFFFQIEFVIEILRLGSAGVSFSEPIQAFLLGAFCVRTRPEFSNRPTVQKYCFPRLSFPLMGMIVDLRKQKCKRIGCGGAVYSCKCQLRQSWIEGRFSPANSSSAISRR